MYPQSMFLSKNKKNIRICLLKIFIFDNFKNLCIFHGPVFVMLTVLISNRIHHLCKHFGLALVILHSITCKKTTSVSYNFVILELSAISGFCCWLAYRPVKIGKSEFAGV